MRAILLSLFMVGSVFAGVSKPPDPTTIPATTGVTTASLVRVNSTNQSYDFFRPWLKKAPYFRRGLGVVVGDGKILVSAELVANRTYVELESPISTEKTPAEIVQVDYDCNLALLKPVEEGFLKDAKPLALDEDAGLGDKADLIQLENTGVVATTPATITTIMVAGYPMDRIALLTFRLSSPLQGREGSFTIPAVRNGKLLGLVMRYDGRNQTADVIPAPVIAHFLADSGKKDYPGFPRIGLAYTPLRDPQLRKYLGLTEPGGVYVTEVRPGGAAAQAGLKKGDVILAVNGKAIDQDGNYNDPKYGLLAFSHLTSTLAHVGDKHAFVVFRDGKRQTIDVTLDTLDPRSTVSEPYVFDRQPRFYILGGLVFQELSRPYLQEWGGNWVKDAPQRLVALDAFQNELPTDRGKIVFLSQVFPSASTLGYEDLEHMIVKQVNGVPIKSLDDLVKAVEKPQNGFHKIEFEDDPPAIYLDAAEVEKSNDQIRQEYGLPELKNLN